VAPVVAAAPAAARAAAPAARGRSWTPLLTRCCSSGATSSRRSWRTPTRASLASEELAFLRDVNDTLAGNQRMWEERATAAEARAGAERARSEARAAEAEEQVRDLMFALEARAGIAALPEAAQADIVGGTFAGMGGAAAGRPARRGGGGALSPPPLSPTAGAGGRGRRPPPEPSADRDAAGVGDGGGVDGDLPSLLRPPGGKGRKR
jgi:hypothetical protein